MLIFSFSLLILDLITPYDTTNMIGFFLYNEFREIKKPEFLESLSMIILGTDVLITNIQINEEVRRTMI